MPTTIEPSTLGAKVFRDRLAVGQRGDILETMERIMSGGQIIVDTKTGVIPYLPLRPLGKRKEDGN